MKYGIQVSILSNHVHFWFNEFVDRFRLLDIFTEKDLVISSDSVKCAKPDQQIFQISFQRILKHFPTLTSSNCLFIDDKAKNVEAAKSIS